MTIGKTYPCYTEYHGAQTVFLDVTRPAHLVWQWLVALPLILVAISIGILTTVLTLKAHERNAAARARAEATSDGQMFYDAEPDRDADDMLGATIKAISGAERRAHHLGAVLQADLESGIGGACGGGAASDGGRGDRVAAATSERSWAMSAPSERRSLPSTLPPPASPLSERRSVGPPARLNRCLTLGHSSVERAMDEMAKALL